jgi:hypothetical protein
LRSDHACNSTRLYLKKYCEMFKTSKNSNWNQLSSNCATSRPNSAQSNSIEFCNVHSTFYLTSLHNWSVLLLRQVVSMKNSFNCFASRFKFKFSTWYSKYVRLMYCSHQPDQLSPRQNVNVFGRQKKNNERSSTSVMLAEQRARCKESFMEVVFQLNVWICASSQWTQMSRALWQHVLTTNGRRIRDKPCHDSCFEYTDIRYT